MLRISTWSILLLGLLGASSCKPETYTFDDNEVPNYDGISTILVQNYVNRLYIDCIGREPTNAEMDDMVSDMEAGGLVDVVREEAVTFLMTDFVYKPLYYTELYGDLKARFLEGASEGIIYDYYWDFREQAIDDSTAGNMLMYAFWQAKADQMTDLLTVPTELGAGMITSKEVCRRMLLNAVYDQINMNSFNFINASFNDLYDRYPTDVEFEAAFNAVEFGQGGVLFGEAVSDKISFTQVLLDNAEWQEGMVRWSFKSIMNREPFDTEVVEGLNIFEPAQSIPSLQKSLMISDEYAGF